MTREEEIKKAARAYISGDILSSPSILIHFANGAGWADEHPNLERLWHDVSEEPKGNYIVLCDGLDNIQWVENYQHIDMYYANWKNYADAFKVNRWAYISDLLPKGGEK